MWYLFSFCYSSGDTLFSRGIQCSGHFHRGLSVFHLALSSSPATSAWPVLHVRKLHFAQFHSHWPSHAVSTNQGHDCNVPVPWLETFFACSFFKSSRRVWNTSACLKHITFWGDDFLFYITNIKRNKFSVTLCSALKLSLAFLFLPLHFCSQGTGYSMTLFFSHLLFPLR